MDQQSRRFLEGRQDTRIRLELRPIGARQSRPSGHAMTAGAQSVRLEPDITLPPPEFHLATSDPEIAKVIRSQPSRWPSLPNENPIWGLIRIVMAQQVSTLV